MLSPSFATGRTDVVKTLPSGKTFKIFLQAFPPGLFAVCNVLLLQVFCDNIGVHLV